MDEHRIVGFSSSHRDELDACSPNLQFGTTIDGDVRLEAAYVVETEAFTEELLSTIPRRIDFASNFFLIVAPGIELQAWVQGAEIFVAANVVPVRVRNEDGCQFRKAGRVRSQCLVCNLGGIRSCTEDGHGPWKGRINPASGNPLTEELSHGMLGRDMPARQRQRDGFRRRIPQTLPKVLEPTAIQNLIDSAGSYRDKAILMLLSRTGQRIGDWSPIAGRHGILGMALEDVDRERRFITVRLKGARDQHRVPVTDDFWPIYEEYLRSERRAAPDVHAVWIASRKGQGKPLR